MNIFRLSNDDVQNELQKLQNFVDYFFSNPFNDDTPRVIRGNFPGVNMFETSEDLIVKAHLPGLKTNQIDISLKGETLILKGKKESLNQETITYLRREREIGDFTRIIDLPFEVDAEKAVAGMKNGVLTIKIAKKENIKPRQIFVKEE